MVFASRKNPTLVCAWGDPRQSAQQAAPPLVSVRAPPPSMKLPRTSLSLAHPSLLYELVMGAMGCKRQRSQARGGSWGKTAGGVECERGANRDRDRGRRVCGLHFHTVFGTALFLGPVTEALAVAGRNVCCLVAMAGPPGIVVNVPHLLRLYLRIIQRPTLNRPPSRHLNSQVPEEEPLHEHDIIGSALALAS